MTIRIALQQKVTSIVKLRGMKFFLSRNFQNISKILLILFFGILFFSCTERTEYDVSEYNLAGLNTSKPLVLALLSSGSALNIKTGVAVPAFEQNENAAQTIVANGFVSQEKNGSVYSLIPDTITNNSYITTLIPEEGGIYSVHLEFPEISGLPLTATDTVPFASVIKSTELTPYAKRVDDNSLTLIRMGIQPPESEKTSFYEITVITQITDSILPNGYLLDSAMQQPGFAYLTSDDPMISGENYYPSVLQLDAFPPKQLYFKKEHGAKKFYVEYYYDPPSITTTSISEKGEQNRASHFFSHKATIVLKTVSRSYYHYHTSRLMQFYSREGDALYGAGEPVNVFSNIQNGVGIFAASCSDTTSILVNNPQ